MHNSELSSEDKLTRLVRDKGIRSWNELTEFIRFLPYGRNRNRMDLSLVLTEKKGTCSSKHAFLKQIADLNNVPDVKLILGVYKMSRENTPKIACVLEEKSIPYIPEAHCYLKIRGKQVDLTTKGTDFSRIEKDILEEKEIEPKQVAEFKVSFHKEFLRKWLPKSGLTFSFDEIWSIRESCIQNLAE